MLIVNAVFELLCDEVDWKRFWKKMRNHKAKRGVLEHVENILLTSDDNYINPWELQKTIPDLEEIKMASLYTDSYSNGIFEPKDIIFAQMTESLLKLTTGRINFAESTNIQKKLGSITKEDIYKFRAEYNYDQFFLSRLTRNRV